MGRGVRSDPNRLVEAAGHHEVGLGVEVAAEGVVAVALQGLQALAGAQLPDLQGLVVAGGGKGEERPSLKPSP